MKNEPVHTTMLRAGRRTYFIDVRLTKTEKLYLDITESRPSEEPNKYIKNNIKVFYEDVKNFRNEIDEICKMYFE